MRRVAGVLDGIERPADLTQFSPAQMEQLAEELREEIIGTVARTGGHLAPSLGVVELTIALHAVLGDPRDRIVWDVGHQSYAHKLLTGRREAFRTLRQAGGLSGFPSRDESPYDAFGTGHASTSISAALGIATARDLAGEHYAVAAVIGDGALTGGLAYEGMNNAGQRGSDLIVVLNDNSMSIAPNVGAMSAYLTRLRADPRYERLKADVESVLRAIPRIGGTVAKTAERLKDGLKHLVVPGTLFEELGFRYLGPLDGHRIPLLMEVLRDARRMGGPVLVHVITRKGQGFAPAEERPDTYHGTGPFDPRTGAVRSGGGAPSYTQVFGEALVRLARRDRRVVAITAAMPEGTGLAAFAREFPDRFFDVGIAEEHAVTFAAGLAAQGLRPVVAVYSTFLQRAVDQVIHDVALQRLPVVFALDRAGVVGEDGATHQGLFDLAYLRAVPGMTLAAPRDEAELVHLLATALAGSVPFALRYPRARGEGVAVPEEPRPVPVGRGQILREGKDAAVLALGPLVAEALRAAEELAREGIRITVADARFIKPLDEAMVRQLAAMPLITVEEHARIGGLGNAVAEFLADAGLMTPLRILGVDDCFVPHGARAQMLEECGLTAQAVAEAVREVRGIRPLAKARGKVR
ncbi:MAG: 1-deoxy-D-xylulose-5-phosphate synthase [Thermaerobacter sp.]|nr:1-deoxy-D-xylulose-5-phosphate synthase [Thermaerobacter sp.]